MIFERYLFRHVDEIQMLRGAKSSVLKDYMKANKCGLVTAAEKYFSYEARLPFLKPDEWEKLREIAHLRNCLVHNGGMARDSEHRKSIYRLETREWQGQSVGIEILRCEGRVVWMPIIIHQRFLEYCLSLLDHFFRTLAEAVQSRFRDGKGT